MEYKMGWSLSAKIVLLSPMINGIHSPVAIDSLVSVSCQIA